MTEPARSAELVHCFFCNSPVPEFPVVTCAHCGVDPRPPRFILTGYRHPNVTHITHSLDQCARWGEDGGHDHCIPVYEERLIDGSACGS